MAHKKDRGNTRIVHGDAGQKLVALESDEEVLLYFKFDEYIPKKNHYSLTHQWFHSRLLKSLRILWSFRSTTIWLLRIPTSRGLLSAVEAVTRDLKCVKFNAYFFVYFLINLRLYIHPSSTTMNEWMNEMKWIVVSSVTRREFFPFFLFLKDTYDKRKFRKQERNVILVERSWSFVSLFFYSKSISIVK